MVSELISFPAGLPLWAKTAEVVPNEEPRAKVILHLGPPSGLPVQVGRRARQEEAKQPQRQCWSKGSLWTPEPSALLMSKPSARGWRRGVRGWEQKQPTVPFPVTAAPASHPFTVSSVQSEPQGNGTALPSGDSLHSVRVLSAGGESHSPSTLGLHLCLKGTKGDTGQTVTCLQKRHGVIRVLNCGWLLSLVPQRPS